MNLNSMQSNTPVILAPIPRRHLLESSASQHWMNAPQAFPQSASSSTTHFRRRLTNRRSFGAPLEGELQQARHSSPSAHHNASRASGKTHESEETAMGRRWIRWMHKRAIKQWVVPGIVAASTLIKFAIGLGSYSGGYTLLLC